MRTPDDVRQPRARACPRCGWHYPEPRLAVYEPGKAHWRCPMCRKEWTTQESQD